MTFEGFFGYFLPLLTPFEPFWTQKLVKMALDALVNWHHFGSFCGRFAAFLTCWAIFEAFQASSEKRGHFGDFGPFFGRFGVILGVIYGSICYSFGRF